MPSGARGPHERGNGRSSEDGQRAGAGGADATSASWSPTTTRCGATPSRATSPMPASRWSRRPTTVAPPWPAPAPPCPTCSCSTSTSRALRCAGVRGARCRRGSDAHPHPVGERRPPGRARRRQGGCPRLPREVGRPRGVHRRRARHGGRRAGVHRGAGRARPRRVPARARPPARGPPRIPELTDRETEILRYVATGMGYKEIAATLFLSHRTVQNHVQNIFGKLQMHNRVELVRFAIERGLDLADPTCRLRSRGRRHTPRRPRGRPGGFGMRTRAGAAATTTLTG